MHRDFFPSIHEWLKSHQHWSYSCCNQDELRFCLLALLLSVIYHITRRGYCLINSMKEGYYCALEILLGHLFLEKGNHRLWVGCFLNLIPEEIRLLLKLWQMLRLNGHLAYFLQAPIFWVLYFTKAFMPKPHHLYHLITFLQYPY